MQTRREYKVQRVQTGRQGALGEWTGRGAVMKALKLKVLLESLLLSILLEERETV